MIVLVQMSKPHGWDDMRTPIRTTGIPARGQRPVVATVEQFVEELKLNGLIGEYRAFMQNGEVWRIKIIRQDKFDAEVHRELPDV